MQNCDFADCIPTGELSLTEKKLRGVVVGGGFGGLEAARTLAKLPVHVSVIDRKNHHTFQPLLYQVATAGISPREIAAPIRWILRGHDNVEVLLGEVVGFDVERRVVRLSDLEIPYDYLVVAAGAGHSYFGNDSWDGLAPGLKTVEDALDFAAACCWPLNLQKGTRLPTKRNRN
jgi:NADH:ubiquinone reductase (H+-translocating)